VTEFRHLRIPLSSSHRVESSRSRAVPPGNRRQPGFPRESPKTSGNPGCAPISWICLTRFLSYDSSCLPSAVNHQLRPEVAVGCSGIGRNRTCLDSGPCFLLPVIHCVRRLPVLWGIRRGNGIRQDSCQKVARVGHIKPEYRADFGVSHRTDASNRPGTHRTASLKPLQARLDRVQARDRVEFAGRKW
jgi:hypothetical protein